MRENERTPKLQQRAQDEALGAQPKHFTLSELLAGMTPERQHKIEDDAPRGAELI